VFFFFWFSDVAEAAIICKPIYPNLAIKKYEQKKKLNNFFGYLLEPRKEIWQLFSGNHWICDKNFENFHTQNKKADAHSLGQKRKE
jgi:hypothetical protein